MHGTHRFVSLCWKWSTFVFAHACYSMRVIGTMCDLVTGCLILKTALHNSTSYNSKLFIERDVMLLLIEHDAMLLIIERDVMLFAIERDVMVLIIEHDVMLLIIERDVMLLIIERDVILLITERDAVQNAIYRYITLVTHREILRLVKLLQMLQLLSKCHEYF